MGKLLRQIISFDNLCRAWEEVTEEESRPGIDGMTVEAFARHWEANLRELQQAVRSNYYRPAPLVRFTVPKRDGSPRLLGNLTLRDKILQRAVLRVLDDADDFIVLCRSQAQAELALRVVDETLATLLLALEPTKTVITSFDQGFEYLGCYFQGEHFYFRYKNDWIKVDQSGDWRLFYQHGPQEYE